MSVDERVYADRKHFSRIVFRRLIRCLRETGQVHPHPVPSRNRRVRNEENIVNILTYFHINPHINLRRTASNYLGIRKWLIQRILRDHHLDPYRMKLHHAQVKSDFDKRLEILRCGIHWISRTLNWKGIMIKGYRYWDAIFTE